MTAPNVDPPSWLVSVRHFLGFDPAAAVGDGIRRGWIVPAPGTYTFATADSEFDTVLYVRNSCASTETVACNDDVDDETATSQLSLTATSAGQEFIVVVDGFYAVSQGQFTVAVTMGPGSDAGMTTMPDAGMSGADAGVGPDAP